MQSLMAKLAHLATDRAITPVVAADVSEDNRALWLNTDAHIFTSLTKAGWQSCIATWVRRKAVFKEQETTKALTKNPDEGDTDNTVALGYRN